MNKKTIFSVTMFMIAFAIALPIVFLMGAASTQQPQNPLQDIASQATFQIKHGTLHATIGDNITIHYYINDLNIMNASFQINNETWSEMP